MHLAARHALRLAIAGALVASSALASAHALLVSSAPTKGQVLEAPPTEIRLTFSEHVEARYTRVKLVDSAGKVLDADRAQPDKNDPNTVALAVPVLKSGNWRATWTTVGTDGHKTRGDLRFSVK